MIFLMFDIAMKYDPHMSINTHFFFTLLQTICRNSSAGRSSLTKVLVCNFVPEHLGERKTEDLKVTGSIVLLNLGFISFFTNTSPRFVASFFAPFLQK